MCGIFAIISEKRDAAQTVLGGLKKLEYRGYDSWGIAVKSKKTESIELEKHVGKIGDAATVTLPQSNIGIGHTRWATHGGILEKNAHPHLDSEKKLAVVHNGIVENYLEIKTDLQKKGYVFRSDTDTEVIAHLIDKEKKALISSRKKNRKELIREAVFSAFGSLIGSNTIVVMDSEHDQLIGCSHGSSIIAGIGKKEFFLASDITAFLKYTNKVVFIKDGEGAVINESGIEIFSNKENKKRQVKIETINWQVEDAQKQGYEHFLLKEIIEQKDTIPRTALLNQSKIESLAEEISKRRQVMLTACGSAYYCTLLAKYLFAQAGVLVEACSANEFIPFSKFYNKNSLLIAVSQSGETADTLIASKIAKKQGARVAAVVNAQGSALERLADDVLSIGAGPEIAVVSTKAFTAQLATLYLLSRAVIGKLDEAQKQIKDLEDSLGGWLNNNLLKRVKKISKSLTNSKDIYIIGKNINYPAGLEFALKIKETSYIHAEAFASGELKHGVLSLIQKTRPCFVLADNNKQIKGEILSSAAQVKVRGGRIIGVSPFNDQVYDDYIQTPDLGELTFIGNIIVGQLLGYYLGIEQGADPDKPRNLAKSVTVK